MDEQQLAELVEASLRREFGARRVDECEELATAFVVICTEPE